MGSPTPALEGVRVLDLSSVGPAARAAALLADYGADVVKVGPVPADAGVQIAPPPYAYSGLRGTRRVRLDLKHPQGRSAFLALVAVADVVIESFRPGTLARLRLGYDELRAARAGVILCSTSGYGQHGPAALRAGHDLNYQAASGVLACAEPAAGGKPPVPGATFADSAGGGMHAVIAILAALVRRDRTGGGCHLDVSVLDGMLSLMSLAVDEYLVTGVVPGPRHGVLTGRYAWYDTYACADGEWVAVAAIEHAFYRNLCELLGCPEWAERQYDEAGDAQDELRTMFAARFAELPRGEWLARLADADTCVNAVAGVADVVADPHVRARGLVVNADHPRAGELRQLGPLLAGMVPAARPLPDPDVTDTAVLLAEAGLGAGEIDELVGRGVVA